MDNVLSLILKDTYTLTLLKHRLSILKSHLVSHFFTDKTEDSTNQADLAWIKSLPDDFYKKFDKDNVYEYFSIAESEIEDLTTLIIYLPFQTDEHIEAQIGELTRKIFNPNLMLDCKYDPNLIAGCALVWKGIYKDYSLRVKIEERKAEVLESFKKYL